MSWELKRLGDFVNIKTGKLDANASSIHGSYPFFTCSREPLQISSYSYDCECVLIAGNGDLNVKYYFGKFDAYQRTYVIESKDKSVLWVRYLYFFLDKYLEKLREQSIGGVIKYIKLENITDAQIPIPPLETQIRIADILDAADALRQKDQELLKKYDELAQAIFIDMFGDPVKNEKRWELKRLGDCLVNIQIGPFGTQLHESDYVKNGIPVINPMHIGNLVLKPNLNYTITEEKYNQLPQYHLKINDVILGRRGEMGRCALINEKHGMCICGTGSLFLTVNKELLDPLFLVYVLSRKSTKIALENISAGTTMSNLNKNIINDFEIILPNLKLQQSFVKAVKLSEMSIKHCLSTFSQSDLFFNSLLQKAFNGELVA